MRWDIDVPPGGDRFFGLSLSIYNAGTSGLPWRAALRHFMVRIGISEAILSEK